MNNNPRTFYALWTSPDKMRNLIPHQCMGTLCYNNCKDITLTLMIPPSQGVISTCYKHYDVLWGKDANGVKYTLFDLNEIEKSIYDCNFSKYEYKVRFILIGEHILSLDTEFFNKCVVQFPRLIDWAYKSKITLLNEPNNIVEYRVSRAKESIAEVAIDDNTKYILNPRCLLDNRGNFLGVTLKQFTEFIVESRGSCSIRSFINYVVEFGNLLSVALFSEQTPTSIVFTREGDRYRQFELLFRYDNEDETPKKALIKFEQLRDKIPSMIKAWHENFNQIFPICNYLISSLNKNREFDAPDFLIIAQALDGYFKRFVNKKDGKNTKQYEHQIKKLLEYFKGVKALQACNLDAKVMAHSRHKYSHLIPDDETKNIEKAVNGEELYYLTQKCIVLLTCCILDNLGLTTEEINICFDGSVIEEIVNDIPFWYIEEE